MEFLKYNYRKWKFNETLFFYVDILFAIHQTKSHNAIIQTHPNVTAAQNKNLNIRN